MCIRDRLTTEQRIFLTEHVIQSGNTYVDALLEKPVKKFCNVKVPNFNAMRTL